MPKRDYQPKYRIPEEEILSQRFYDLHELAKILSVSEQTAKRYLQQGKITGYKINGVSWRVKPSDLQAYLDKWKNNAE